MVTLTKTAVTLYDIATNPQGATNYNTMDTREAEANIRCALELGDTIQDYDTTDRTGNPLRVVLHICTSTDRDDLGGVYEIPLNPEPEGNTATELAIDAHLGLWPAPWTVRRHPEPHGRQHPWLWSCDATGCETGGVGVNEGDAHGHAADHYTRQHTDA